MNVLIVIPARGGSKGIPRKNVRLLCGKPLITYVINTSKNLSFNPDIVVSSDSEEVLNISSRLGTDTLERPTFLSTDSITLDPVVNHATISMENRKNKRYDIVITVQPTSPLLRTETLNKALSIMQNSDFDSVISVINKPHLAWTNLDNNIIPKYSVRLNRQYLPPHYIETGAFLITKRNYVTDSSRLGNNISVVEIPLDESIDIDNPEDWWVAEKILLKKNIIFRVDGYNDIGLGHIYRCLLLAYNLIEHNILFVLNTKSDIGIEKIRMSNFPYIVINDDNDIHNIIDSFKCNILINDILDTTSNYIIGCKSHNIRIVNFEDLGKGAKYADAVINDLYEKKNNNINHFWGSDYYLIRDEFLFSKESKFHKKVKNVLIIFGGTDPLNLTKKLINIVQNLDTKINYNFVIGLGYKFKNELLEVSNKFQNIKIFFDIKSMSEIMYKSDIAISSQGRTMLELASMQVPTILIAQNNRELHHEFGYLRNGFINLGLGKDIQDSTIQDTINLIINNSQIRLQMKNQMKQKNLKNGLKKVLNIIFENIEEL